MNKKGFTLTELIVVIVIIGIISLITIPNIMKALQKSREQNGEAVEKMLVHNLELYNTDYKEDLWCLDKCEDKDPDHEDGNNEDGDIVTTQKIGISDLMNMNPDIDMGDCLLQDDDSLQITKVETITNQGTENEKRDYKYTYSAKIICSTDFKNVAADDKIFNSSFSLNNVYYKTGE